jgi:protein-tyrosine phosphatase
LQRLTATGLGTLADHGVDVIVDLRSQVERERDVTPDPATAGIRHVFAPVFEEDHSPVAMDVEFPGYYVVYQRMLESGHNAYRTLFETIENTVGRVLFHCSAGKDRTGIGAALMLGLAGVEERVIVEDYAVSYELLAPLFDEWLPKMAERGIDEQRGKQLMGSPPDAMENTLAHIHGALRWACGYLKHRLHGHARRSRRGSSPSSRGASHRRETIRPLRVRCRSAPRSVADLASSASSCAW